MKDDAQTLVKVVIPIYKIQLTRYEQISLAQAYRIWQNKYPLTIIKPQHLDLTPLLTEYPLLATESFDDKYFANIHGYNSLMLSAEFYERFVCSEYILIYQLDAYVFNDELEQWCKKGYDYIGAPWLVRPIYNFPLLKFASWIKKQYCNLLHCTNSQASNFKVGNGGLSLRKTAAHLHAVNQLKDIVQQYLSHENNHMFNEDVVFALETNQHGINFRHPHYTEALAFSFDKYPALCFKLNSNHLPFGCHGWYKRRMKKFWFPIILKK